MDMEITFFNCPILPKKTLHTSANEFHKKLKHFIPSLALKIGHKQNSHFAGPPHKKSFNPIFFSLILNKRKRISS